MQKECIKPLFLIAGVSYLIFKVCDGLQSDSAFTLCYSWESIAHIYTCSQMLLFYSVLLLRVNTRCFTVYVAWRSVSAFNSVLQLGVNTRCFTVCAAWQSASAFFSVL